MIEHGPARIRTGDSSARDSLASPCESDVIARLDHGPSRAVPRPDNDLYFFSPTERFLSLRSDDLHFLHLSALSGFLAPHLRQTWRKSLLFWAICFFVASAMGTVSTWLAGCPPADDYQGFGRRRAGQRKPRGPKVPGAGATRVKPFITLSSRAALKNR